MNRLSESTSADTEPDQKPARVIVFGEILFDEFPDRRVLGGAPFNVAHHLRGFGADPLLITRVGEDARGDEALAAMRRAGLDARGVQRDPRRPTGSVAVRLSGAGHRFEILAEQAYDFVDAERAALAAPPGCDLFYFGTLAQRHPESRSALFALLAGGARTRFLDVNLREPWYDRETIERSLRHADVLKINREELAEVGAIFFAGLAEGPELASRLVERFSLRRVVVTCGEEGAWLLDAGGGLERVAGGRLAGDVADTVGAGDGFSAVLILGTLRGWDGATALRRADAFARAVCSIRGAVPEDPSFYLPYVREWAADTLLQRTT